MDIDVPACLDAVWQQDLLHALAVVPDPWRGRGVRYRLASMLAVAVFPGSAPGHFEFGLGMGDEGVEVGSGAGQVPAAILLGGAFFGNALVAALDDLVESMLCGGDLVHPAGASGN